MTDKQDANRKRTDTGWPPGSIGDLSVRVGYDVRDLKIAGYEWDEIQEVADGKITLAELWRRGPRKRRSKNDQEASRGL
ncbi:MAG: hypothetical protein M9918_21720 [Anaerolineae bacterium]|nr:hypothetical protein [Anaerolineae bacterium]MCO5194171.1 hypothetical protein [Anaerolineae bacterium]